MADERDTEGLSTSHFASQNATSEDMLKSQVVGLVNLSDFRKRRAEAVESKDREALDGRSSGRASSAATPGEGSPAPEPSKKRKKKPVKGKLSFTLDDEELDHSHTPCGETSHSLKTAETPEAQSSTAEGQEETSRSKRLGPNNAITNAPKAMTKSALSKEAHTKDRLRKEFLIVQDIIKNTNIVIPFVFYDGTNIPGGSPRMKKGDPTWLFLDRARKVGAELGVGGADSARREWARVSVDDLMLVRHEIIIPHHYDFYYFIMNETQGFQGSLFDYTNRPRDAAVSNVPGNDNGSLNSGKTPGSSNGPLEGAEHDPNLTKVVDRRWYERNKHIYPASIWEEFDPTKDYAKGMRKDVQGNSFFFS